MVYLEPMYLGLVKAFIGIGHPLLNRSMLNYFISVIVATTGTFVYRKVHKKKYSHSYEELDRQGDAVDGV